MPAGTLGFRAAGDIEREDIDELEPSALWADSKLGFEIGVSAQLEDAKAWVAGGAS